MKKTIGFIMTLCLLLTGCDEATVSDITDQAMNIAQAEDENVLGIKGASPNGYKQTYGEAFDEFFAYPAWKYFKGTQNGPDEDSDGKPDYEINDIDIVEFTGYCTYNDDVYYDEIYGTVSLEDGYLRVRNIPSTDGDIIGEIYDKTQVVITNTDIDEWYEIEYNGGVGYVFSDYIIIN